MKSSLIHSVSLSMIGSSFVNVTYISVSYEYTNILHTTLSVYSSFVPESNPNEQNENDNNSAIIAVAICVPIAAIIIIAIIVIVIIRRKRKVMESSECNIEDEIISHDDSSESGDMLKKENIFI